MYRKIDLVAQQSSLQLLGKNTNPTKQFKRSLLVDVSSGLKNGQASLLTKCSTNTVCLHQCERTSSATYSDY